MEAENKDSKKPSFFEVLMSSVLIAVCSYLVPLPLWINSGDFSVNQLYAQIYSDRPYVLMTVIYVVISLIAGIIISSNTQKFPIGRLIITTVIGMMFLIFFVIPASQIGGDVIINYFIQVIAPLLIAASGRYFLKNRNK